jgi:hypothetical protein
MTPIEAAIKGSNEIFCSNFYFYQYAAKGARKRNKDTDNFLVTVGDEPKHPPD